MAVAEDDIGNFAKPGCGGLGSGTGSALGSDESEMGLGR